MRIRDSNQYAANVCDALVDAGRSGSEVDSCYCCGVVVVVVEG